MLDSLRSFFEPDLESDIFHGFFLFLVVTLVVEKTWKREGEDIVERDLWRDLTEKIKLIIYHSSSNVVDNFSTLVVKTVVSIGCSRTQQTNKSSQPHAWA